ncbi:hypothetical protein DPMN_070706 [Dreissena polymorpha]|uniref:Uncharacterized protein n=1 Tax=Dreissena polymorpha TaxID=45954 RepID=A0A9D3Z3K7_DREPO|nr:hypothetical protein DPMN_070706 [Dreissena polymorpha]
MKTAQPPDGQYIIRTNVLKIFHEHWTINMNSRVLTRKTAQPPGGHINQQTATIANVLTKFHVDWNINVTSRMKTAAPPGGHENYIIDTNILTKFHEDCTINLTSTPRFLQTKTIFIHIQDII